MSYILDALKKSELERRSPAAPRPTPTVSSGVSVQPRATPVPAQPSEERKFGHWYWIIGGALLVNGGFTLFHHYNDPRHSAGSAAATAEKTLAQVAQNKLVQPSTAVQPKMAPVASVTDMDTAPLLKDKPASYRDNVPKLNVDLHVYAERPAERFALINMTKFREGDDIGRGLTLQQITPTGLIIAYQGETFRIDTRY